ncbi:prefoldin subunit alpha [candidate division KSB1 bacterium]
MAEKKKEESSAEKMQEELQKKYMELQFLSQQISEIQKQMQNMDAQIIDLETTNESLDEISKTEPGADMFVPISSGVFAKAEFKDTKKLLVNVGAGTAVEKPVADVKKMIEDQVGEISKYKDQANEQLERLIEHAKMIENELKTLI